MIPVFIPVCLKCKHLFKKDNKVCCKAYPDGIPQEVIKKKATTDKEKPCPNGYAYEHR
jgi:hypothetical protein